MTSEKALKDGSTIGLNDSAARSEIRKVHFLIVVQRFKPFKDSSRSKIPARRKILCCLVALSGLDPIELRRE